jgi:hypothetical protein
LGGLNVGEDGVFLHREEDSVDVGDARHKACMRGTREVTSAG